MNLLKKMFPATLDELDKTLFTGVDDTEDEKTMNNNNGGFINNAYTNLKCVYSIFDDDKALVLFVPIVKPTAIITTNNTVEYKLTASNALNSKPEMFYTLWKRYSDYYPKRKICSRYLNEYIEEVVIYKSSPMRYNIRIRSKMGTLGAEQHTWTGPQHIKEKRSTSFSDIVGSIVIETMTEENVGLNKKQITEIYDDFTSVGVKITIKGANSFKELTDPAKKDKNPKLMSLKINNRVIAYDKYKKKFLCRIGKENRESSEFDDTECKNIIKAARVSISFTTGYDRYADASGFSYTLKLLSNDATKSIDDYYCGNGCDDGITEFYTVEDENIFDIVREFRKLGIPTSLCGIKNLLNIYRRTQKLVDIVNEDFPEDVLLAEIGDDGIAF